MNDKSVFSPTYRDTGLADCRRKYPVIGNCEHCVVAVAVERHHKDRDHWNNERSNVEFVCRRCHILAHGDVPMSASYPRYVAPVASGALFGMLQVICELPMRDDRRQFLCGCTCGLMTIAPLYKLRSGATKSCGCLRRSGLHTTHGFVRGGKIPSEYRIWQAIKNRCLNPNSNRYSDYGGRGITVFPSWIASFSDFLADVGPRPSAKHSWDRQDNNGDYSPGNVRWATPKEQARNQRKNVYLACDGEKALLLDWAKRLGVNADTLWSRRRSGWSDEQIIKTPVRYIRRIEERLVRDADEALAPQRAFEVPK